MTETSDFVPETTTPCRACGGTAVTTDWGGAVCQECRSVQVLKLPTPEALSAFYESFNRRYWGGGRSRAAGVRQARWAARYLKEARAVRPAGRLIDVGSSTNPFPNLAAEAGYDVTCCDFDRPAGLLPQVHFVQGSLDDGAEALSLDGEKFDLVTAFAVLEHCRSPQVAVSRLASLCAPGGKVLVTVPEVGGFADRHAMGRTPWFYPPAHLHLLSRRALVEAFGRAGLRPEKTKKLEIGPVRWLARYGLAAAEGVAGAACWAVAPRCWAAARRRRVSRCQGIVFCCFGGGAI